MDLNYLRSLVKIFDTSKATELSINEEGVEIYLSKKSDCPPQMQAYNPPTQMQFFNEKAPEAPIPAAPIAVSPALEENLHIIKSPIVGTFYRKPSPDSPAYTEIGAKVEKGKTLCIIEAMKLMNEIESDVAGTIEKIFVDDGNPVEYNQPLFGIKI